MAKVVARTACGTSDRLRMKTAVGGIVIFRVAVFIQRPLPHRCIRTVVRQSEDHRVARAAIGAIDIGIFVARVGGIEQFFQTFIADREIWRDANGRGFASLALSNGELIQTQWNGVMHFDFRDTGCGRRLRFQLLHKSLKPRLGAFDKNLNAFIAVEHPSGERIGLRKAIDVGTKANTLHHSANSNGTSAGDCYGHSASTMQLRPCQPTCTTLPSSTSTGTLRSPAATLLMRWRAAASASTSYSMKSLRFHSSHSRISCV